MINSAICSHKICRLPHPLRSCSIISGRCVKSNYNHRPSPRPRPDHSQIILSLSCLIANVSHQQWSKYLTIFHQIWIFNVSSIYVKITYSLKCFLLLNMGNMYRNIHPYLWWGVTVIQEPINPSVFVHNRENMNHIFPHFVHCPPASFLWLNCEWAHGVLLYVISGPSTCTV